MKLFDRRGAMTLPREDYEILWNEAKGKKSVLEFGPGFSTYAFIEAGVPRILCCEYLDKWFEFAKERFKDYPQVEIRRFLDEAPVATFEVRPGVFKSESLENFEIALVDSPKGYAGARTIHPGQEDCSRLNTCLLALMHSPVVLLHDAYRPLERGTLGRLSAAGHRVTFYNKASRGGLARIERNANDKGAVGQ
jgi:hypothetical protein